MLNHIFGPDLVLRTNLAITRLGYSNRQELRIDCYINTAQVWGLSIFGLQAEVTALNVTNAKVLSCADHQGNKRPTALSEDSHQISSQSIGN